MRSTSKGKPNQGLQDSRDRERQINLETLQDSSSARHSKSRRTATLYDAVAGRVGPQGFLNLEQVHSGYPRPSAPKEVLLRRANAPDRVSYDFYSADEKLGPSQILPDSDLLKNLHTYVADYYERAHGDDHKVDFQSMDETALLAMGILLEEACKEALGENGDMVFTESERHDQQASRSRLAQHQIIGGVVPEKVQEYQSSSDEEDERDRARAGVHDADMSRPRKRQRRRYQDSDMD